MRFAIAALASVLGFASASQARPHLFGKRHCQTHAVQMSQCQTATYQNSTSQAVAYQGVNYQDSAGQVITYQDAISVNAEHQNVSYAAATYQSQSFSQQYQSTDATLNVVNRYRQQQNLRPLTLDPQLCAYSQQWSQTMARFGFEHSTDWFKFGGLEVIAWGHQSPEDVVKGWMESTRHRNAIMSPNVTRFGIGRVGNLWTGLTGR